MKLFKLFLLMLPALCCQFIVKANGGKKLRSDSAVQGSVTDAVTKKPLGDVTVSFSSGKQPKKKEVKSDAAGFFISPQMAPGEFTLYLEKKGYKSYRKDYVMMKDGLQLSLSLEPEDDDSGIDSWNPLKVLYGR